MTPMLSVERIVTDVGRAERIDAATLSRILGTTLTVTDDSGPFRLHEADAAIGVLKIAADYRQPVPARGAQAGAILVLNLAGACVAREEVLARFAPLAIAQVPSGRSENERTSWARPTDWGSLSFGFTVAKPDCLDTIAFQFKPGR